MRFVERQSEDVAPRAFQLLLACGVSLLPTKHFAYDVSEK